MSTKLVRRITQAAAVALVVVGYSAASWADGPKGSTGNAPVAAPVTLRFDAKTCSANERASVNEAFAMARQRAAEGLQVARANPNDPRLLRWFGEGHYQRIVEVLQAVVRQLDTPDFTIGCASTAYCVQRQPMAYTSFADRVVGFCAGFFSAALTGEDSRFGTVIHELSHLSAHTQDNAYGRTNARTLAVKQSDRASNNADTYEYFCETLRE
jgi:peptidyl-Lys metalloendopeptidase